MALFNLGKYKQTEDRNGEGVLLWRVFYATRSLDMHIPHLWSMNVCVPSILIIDCVYFPLQFSYVS